MNENVANYLKTILNYYYGKSILLEFDAVDQERYMSEEIEQYIEVTNEQLEEMFVLARQINLPDKERELFEMMYEEYLLNK